MKTMTAIVSEGNRLELTEDLAIPAGTRVRVRIETGPGDDYDAKLREYYRDCTPEMLAEERGLAEQWAAADAPLAPEEPWW